MDPFDGLFEEGHYGRGVSDLGEVLDFMNNAIDEGKLNQVDAIESLLNLARPGSTEASHDVLSLFKVAMAVLGFNEIGKQCEGLWLTVFPWGIGFHMGFFGDYPVAAISPEGRAAVVRSLAAVLQSGGVDAEYTSEGKIRITNEEGEEQHIGIEHVMREFREQIDEELGPSITPPDPTITDWMKRWMG